VQTEQRMTCDEILLAIAARGWSHAARQEVQTCLQTLEHGVEDPLAPSLDGVLVGCELQAKKTVRMRRFKAWGVQATTRVTEEEGGRGKGCVSPSASIAALCASTSFWRTSAAGLCTVFAASFLCCDTETIASSCRESSAGWSAVAGLLSLTESVFKRFATCTSASCIKRMRKSECAGCSLCHMHEILIPRGSA